VIKVLVVDDSIFMRTLVSDLINSDPQMEVVGTAKSGAEALKKLPQLKPDVVTLDMVMPGWDGLTTLKEIMARFPTPVVLLSAHTKEGADLTIRCLEAGAISFVLKPSGELSLDIQDVKSHLLQELRSASLVKTDKFKIYAHKKSIEPKSRVSGIRSILVIGASTGGPQTLECILTSLPEDFSSPIIVIQHMPNYSFSQGFADRLDRLCALTARVPASGEALKGGTIYVVPGGFQMTLKTEPGTVSEAFFCLKETHKRDLSPSIDAAMRSAAAIYGERCTGLILTGMGHDGLEGMKAIKAHGGQTIAQDESALIYGMPKAVIDAGAADKALPAEKIAEHLCEVESCRRM
jgi:two-component system, chemotaxis family, protein-glutamate methylesterase/glutaminase